MPMAPKISRVPNERLALGALGVVVKLAFGRAAMVPCLGGFDRSRRRAADSERADTGSGCYRPEAAVGCRSGSFGVYVVRGISPRRMPISLGFWSVKKYQNWHAKWM
jgi:hypothetical protein